MAGAASRRKGKTSEQEAVDILKEAGYPRAKRSGVAGQVDGDLHHTGDWQIEVKRRETLALPAWWRQATETCAEDKTPLRVYRRSNERWMAVLYLDDLLALEGTPQMGGVAPDDDPPKPGVLAPNGE